MEITPTAKPEGLSSPFGLFQKLANETLIGEAATKFVLPILVVTLIVFAVITPILFYHWNKYAVTDRERFAAKTVYTLISATLIIFLFGTAYPLLNS